MKLFSDVYFGEVNHLFLHGSSSHDRLFIKRDNCNVKITKRYVDGAMFDIKTKHFPNDFLKMTIKPFSTVKVVSIRHVDADANIIPCYWVELMESKNGVTYHKYNLKPKYKYRCVKESDLK